MPLVRRLAAAHDIDLRDVAGSGPAGAVTRRDVERVIAARAAAPRAAAAPSDDGERRVRLPRIRRTIAAHLSRSWREIPHVTVFADVDAGALLRTRRLLEERRGGPLPLEALLVAAVVPLLEEFPEFNAFVDGDEVVYRSRRDVGIAVDTPDGLIVPVLRGADTLRLDELADRILELVSLAGSRRIPPEDASGQTFTVSNIGALGGGHGTPIIPSGTAAILSVGRAREAPAVRDGAVVVAPLMPVSLSFDHRLIDGGLGQRFLAALEANLTEPLRFLVP